MSESLKSDLRKVQVLALEVAVEALQEECDALRVVAENTVSLLEHLTAHANLSARNYVMCERVLVQAREAIAKEQP